MEVDEKEEVACEVRDPLRVSDGLNVCICIQKYVSSPNPYMYTAGLLLYKV